MRSKRKEDIHDKKIHKKEIKQKFQSKRFLEIDFLRGIALLMMIVYHILFGLDYLDIYKIDTGSGFWLLFARVIQFLFIGIAGVSCVLFFNRYKSYKKVIYRGVVIFMSGMLITLFSYLALDKGFVIFGILHFIGISVILSVFFIRYSNINTLINILLAVIILSLENVVRNIVLDHPYLVWLGFPYHGFYTLDYFPLIPWFGIFLIGMSIGNIRYMKENLNSSLENYLRKHKMFFMPLFFIGRKTLIIYLLHVPVLAIALFLLKFLI